MKRTAAPVAADEPGAPRRSGVGDPKKTAAISQFSPRINGRIRAREVRVIVGSTNEQLGVLTIQDAMRKARSLELDLVEVAPNANPPVCRIVDFGKFRYEQAKLEKDRRTVATKLKEIKFRVNIDEHDYFTKIRHAESFLDKGNKIRVQLQFRGRENAHEELGFRLMDRVKADLQTMANVEMEPRRMGRNINMTLSPLPTQRRKKRWTVDEEELEPMPEDPADDEGDEGGEIAEGGEE